MASDSDRPEIAAFLEIENLVRNVGEELAGFRRRAQTAESKLKDSGGGRGRGSGRNTAELEDEIEVLREKLQKATSRTKQLLERVRILRQQQSRGE